MLNAAKERLVSIVRKTSIGRSLFYAGDDQRTIATRDNVIFSSVFRGFGMVAGLLMVPLTLNYLDTEKYGIWLTLTSVVAWFNFFDVGLGNGLRNKLAEALAINNDSLAKGYVSTTYALLTAIMMVLGLVFVIVNQFIDWTSVFNVSETMRADLSILVLIVFIFFAFRFVLGLIIVVLNADQKIGKSSFLDLLNAVLSLACVYGISQWLPGSLMGLGIILSGVPVMVFVLGSIWYFRTSYAKIAPDLKHVRFSLVRDLFRLSIQFFVLQAIVLLIFFSNNIIIAQLIGPSSVSEFNIVYKYYSVITTVSVLIINPFWSAATDAYFKKDFSWLRSSSRKLVKIWLLVSGVAILMALLAPYAYHFWIGDKIVIAYSSTILMCLFVILFAWHNSFVYLINGIGKIRLQLYIYVVMGILVIPLSIFFIKTLGLGIDGSILAMIICLIPASVLIPIQFYRIIDERATGLFDQ